MDNFKDSYYRRKPRLIVNILIYFMCAVLGGVVAVKLVPAVNQSSIGTGNKVVLHQGEAAPLTATGTGSSDYPVVNVSKTVGPAVVGISNFQYKGNILGGSNTGLAEAGSGSGFIIDEKNGYIVTNNHVVEGAEKLMVSLSDGRSVEGALVGADSKTDLAVVKINDTSNLQAVQLGDSTVLQTGQPVVAIGNPGGQEFARTVTNGVISATDRFLELQGEASFNLIQTDAAINPGNSGGPLVNYSGQVVGINSAKYNQTGFEGMGFAIPITDALPTIQQLIEKGYASHPALMINIDDRYTEEYATYKGTPAGCYVSKVQAGGAAEKAGIRAGDVITALNGTKIGNSLELNHQLFKYNVGDKITVSYYRGGNTYNADLTLGELRSS